MTKPSLRKIANVQINVIELARQLIAAGVKRASLVDFDELVRLEATRGDNVTIQDILAHLPQRCFEASPGPTEHAAAILENA